MSGIALLSPPLALANPRLPLLAVLAVAPPCPLRVVPTSRLTTLSLHQAPDANRRPNTVLTSTGHLSSSPLELRVLDASAATLSSFNLLPLVLLSPLRGTLAGVEGNPGLVLVTGALLSGHYLRANPQTSLELSHALNDLLLKIIFGERNPKSL